MCHRACPFEDMDILGRLSSGMDSAMYSVIGVPRSHNHLWHSRRVGHGRRKTLTKEKTPLHHQISSKSTIALLVQTQMEGYLSSDPTAKKFYQRHDQS